MRLGCPTRVSTDPKRARQARRTTDSETEQPASGSGRAYTREASTAPEAAWESNREDSNTQEAQPAEAEAAALTADRAAAQPPAESASPHR